MSLSARTESALAGIVKPILRSAVLGAQVGAYATVVFTAILAYGSFVTHRVYPFIETLLHFSLALLVCTTVPLLFDLASRRLRRRTVAGRSRLAPALLSIVLAICAVGALFCLPLLEPLYDAGRTMIRDGLAGRLHSEDPARMPLSAWITFSTFAYFLIAGTLVSLRHCVGFMADLSSDDVEEEETEHELDLVETSTGAGQTALNSHGDLHQRSPWLTGQKPTHEKSADREGPRF